MKIDFNALILALLWFTAICESLVEQNHCEFNSTSFHQTDK